MRRGPFLVMLALLLGAAPALAQSPGLMPTPQQPNTKPAKEHLKRKAVAAKPAEAKPAEAKPARAKPSGRRKPGDR